MAKVDKYGRIILYYRNDGTPIYASSSDENQSYPDVNTESSNDRFRGFTDQTHGDDNDSRTGHRDNDPKRDRNYKGDRDRPKNNGNGGHSNNLALYKLVRGQDGTLQVQYVDAKTGKVIPYNMLSHYTVSTVASTLNSVNDIRNGKFTDTKTGGDDDKNKKKDKGDKDVIQHGSGGDPWNEHSANGSFGGPNSKTQAPGGTGKNTDTGTPSAPSKNEVEQGDTDQTPDSPDNTNTNTNGVFGDQDKLAGMLGQPNDPSVTGMTAPNYTKDQISDIGKTLAGEIDSRFTDLNTPEGFHEAAAITSTVQNRADMFGGDVSKAIHDPHAYSAWDPDKVATTMSNYNQNPGFWDGLAAGIVAHPQLREGFTNYVNPSIAHPGWVDNLQDKTKIGPHLFGVDPTIDAKVKQAQVNASPPTVTTDQSNWTQSPIGVDRPTVTGGWNDMAKAGPLGITAAPSTMAQGPTVTGGWNDMAKAGPFGGDWTDPGGRFVGGPVSPSDNSFNSMAQAGPISSPNLGGPDYSPTTGFAQGYQPSTNPSPAGVYGDPTGGYNNTNKVDNNPSDNSFNSMAKEGAISSPSVPSTTDRFGTPSNFDSSRFGAPAFNGQPTSDAAKNTVGTYGSLTGGFGGYVTTDANATANSGAVAAHNQENISNPSSNVTSQSPTSQTNTTSTTADNSDIGGISSAPGISSPGMGSTDTGASTSSSPSASTSGADVGGSTHDTTGGFTGSPDTTGSTTDTGATSGVFGGLNGIFGGSTDTDTSGTDTGSTNSTDTSGTSSGPSATGSSSFSGGFSDGFL